MWCKCWVGSIMMIRWIENQIAYLCPPADYYNDVQGVLDMSPIRRGNVDQYSKVEPMTVV